METALEAASWLFDKVLGKLSHDLVAAYVSSKELDLNYEMIEARLLETQAVLHAAQQRDVSDNSGLRKLLQKLGNKADEAEDALDELHYFMIQDKLDGTREAVPDLGDGLGNEVQHVRHAVRHTAGNWFSYFSCCRNQTDADIVDVVKNNPQNATTTIKSDRSTDQPDEKLPFDRVAMSNKIKQLIEGIHSQCDQIIKLLQISPSSNPQQAVSTTLKRPISSATIIQNQLYGRDAIFNQTIDDLTSGTYHETLSVLPIVGPGGIGKTTFTQHLYHDERIKVRFPVRIWVCVSTNFDVLKLTQQILSCILAADNEDSNRENNTSNLTLLHERIGKRLKSKSFLIVFDDIWECKSKSEWDTLLGPFEKGETKGNMVLVTTRFPKIANMVKKEATNPIIDLRGLEPDEFWKFFQNCVFGEVKDERDKDDLIDIAKQISDKLKCNPLAAKTVAPLLQKNHSREHWIEILSKKEWENLRHSDDDIMPVLKISYDYLPLHLKKCFSYCALFPEDHKFHSSELLCFWDAIGINDTCGQIDRGEDLVNKLVENGFLIKQDDGSSQYYVLHDLFHQLSQSVSSQDCVNICFSGFIADNIPPSVRHVSVTIKRTCFENWKEEMDKLKRRLDIQNLRSLMVFQRYRNKRIADVLKHTFSKIKGLRVLFIPMSSPEDLPHDFSKLIHLRFLRIETFSSVSLPSAISRFYHLNTLVVPHVYDSPICVVPKDFNRLINLRCLNASSEFHSNIPGVGKMQCLEELCVFSVKKESVGFELAELGKLTKLGGELHICNLENVRTKEEAKEAKLKNKCNLRKLALTYDDERHPRATHDVIDGFEPHRSLTKLEICNHRGATGPNWLCRNICVTSLERLSLSGISWDILPPFGRLPLLRCLKLTNIGGLQQFRLDSGGVTNRSFKHLKKVSLHHMADLVEWVLGDNSHLCSGLETITCSDCPNIRMLPFFDCNGPSAKGTDTTWFNNLRKLKIQNCPNLSQLPPFPYTSTLTDVEVLHRGHETKLWNRARSLTIDGYSGSLAFHNLGKVEKLSIENASHILVSDLQKLTSLRQLDVTGDMFCGELGDSVVLNSVQKLSLSKFHATERLLSNVFKCLPTLSELEMSYSNEDHAEPVVLQIPSSCLLRKVSLYHCNNLVLNAEVGGLGNLTSLHSLNIDFCDKIFSQMSLAEASQNSIKPFPTSLRELELDCVFEPQSMALLSNLTSLTRLSLRGCYKLTMDGFNPLVMRNLKSLRILRCDSLTVNLLLSESEVARARTEPAGFCPLEDIKVDSIATMLVDSVCSHLSSSLRTLSFSFDRTIERFTEEQQAALQLLTSLEELKFCYCSSLRSLPEALHRLCSLKKLTIFDCEKIQSLPVSGLPASLEFLDVAITCSEELRTVLMELQESHPDLDISIDD